jgi:hypothetical protein
MSRHSWRLYTSSSPDTAFDTANALSRITAGAEPAPIDHWFEAPYAVFSGRGPVPEDPHIFRAPCRDCHTHAGPCDLCCGNGFVLMWATVPAALVQETVDGLRSIINELEEPTLV